MASTTNGIGHQARPGRSQAGARPPRASNHPDHPVPEGPTAMSDDDTGPAARFPAKLLATGTTSTGIQVPPQVINQFGGGKRPPVKVTIGSYSYRTTVGVMGGKALIPVSADHRRQAGLTAGDNIEVELELDTQPRDVELPADFALALGNDTAARRFFDQLSPSQKKWHVQSVETAKTEETRQRRITKSVDLLRQQRAR